MLYQITEWKWLVMNYSGEIYDKVNNTCKNPYYMLYQPSTYICPWTSGSLAAIGYSGWCSMWYGFFHVLFSLPRYIVSYRQEMFSIIHIDVWAFSPMDLAEGAKLFVITLSQSFLQCGFESHRGKTNTFAS